MKWVKSNDGHYYNMSDIKDINWSKNGSAVGASFELKAESSTGIHILARCDSEADKQVISDKLEAFLISDGNFLTLPKI